MGVSPKGTVTIPGFGYQSLRPRKRGNMMKRDIMSVVRRSAKAGEVGTRMAIYPSEVRKLRDKGFVVVTSKRGVCAASEKHTTECEVFWDNAKQGTIAYRYWKYVIQHRRDNAKQSRDNVRGGRKQDAYEVLCDVFMDDDEDFPDEGADIPVLI